MTVETTPWCDQAPLEGYLGALGVSPQATAEKGGEREPPLLLHASLALSLQQAVAQEVGLEEAVVAWQEAAERLSRRHRQHRAGTLLVSLEAALAAPEALRQALEEKGLAVPLANDAKSVRPLVAPFYRLLAEHLIQHREPLRAQVRLLEALSPPLGDAEASATYPDIGGETLDPAAVLQMHLEGQAALEERVQAHNKASLALKAELEQQRHQAEEQSQAAMRHRQEAEQSRQEAAEHQETVKVLRLELHNLTQHLEEESGLLLAQLHLVQEKFERVILEQRAEQEERELAALSPRERQARRLHESEWFDTDWYLAQYPDVRESGADPVEHYLMYGARLGRNPGPRFDTEAYLTRYPDVVESGINPLYHFVVYGHAEHRNPGRLESEEA